MTSGQVCLIPCHTFIRYSSGDRPGRPHSLPWCPSRRHPSTSPPPSTHPPYPRCPLPSSSRLSSSTRPTPIPLSDPYTIHTPLFISILSIFDIFFHPPPCAPAPHLIALLVPTDFVWCILDACWVLGPPATNHFTWSRDESLIKWSAIRRVEHVVSLEKSHMWASEAVATFLEVPEQKRIYHCYPTLVP